MIAKIIAHGPTRAVALARLARALERTQVAGTVTNIAFLARLAGHPGFAAGEVDTGLIGRDIAWLTAPPADGGLGQAVEVTALLAAADLPAGPMAGFALWAPLCHPVVLEGGRLGGVVEPLGPDAARVEIGGRHFRAGRGAEGWSVEGRAPLPVVRAQGAIHVFAPDGRGAASFRLHDPLDRDAAGAADDGIARSPLPGLVRAVTVAAGEAVAAGARLAVIESMKMEHAVTAGAAGRVTEVLVGAGDQVEAGTPLVRLEALP
jgi:3-methylcrotonyl-CoA carboxylase alpha subunit